MRLIGMAGEAEIQALRCQLDKANVAIAAMRESEAHYRTLSSSFDEGFMEVEVVQDASGRAIDMRYVKCNPALERLTGLKDVEGRLLSEVLPDSEPEWVERLGYVARTGEAIRFELPASGLGRWFSVYFARLGHAGSRRVVAIYSDITERKRAELASRESEERQAFLLRLSDALRAEPSAEAITERALRMLFDHMRLDRSYVGVYRQEEDRGEFPHQVHDDHLPPMPAHVRLSDFPEGLQIVVDRTLVIDDLMKMKSLSDSERASFAGLGMGALITATLRKGENIPLWAICAGSARPRVWTQGEVALVEEVAERTWAAAERARADADLRKSEAKYRTVFETIDQAFWMIEVIQDASGKVTDYRFLEANPNIERVTGLTNVVGRLVSDVVPKLESYWMEPLTRVIQTGELGRMEAYNNNTGRWYRSVNSRIGGEGSRLIGVFFDDITERKEQEHRQTFLLTLSDALRPLSDPEAIQGEASRVLGEHLQSGRAYYVEVDEEAGEYVVARDWHLPGETSHAGRFPLADWPMPWLADGRTWVVRDTATGHGLPDGQRDAYRGQGVGALITVPLIKNGRLVATCATDQRAPRDWTPAEIRLVEETAERTWAAVEQARAEATLREALSRNAERLEARVRERTAELMAAEESLRHSQKMEAIGQLTGGIAHDFNNMLQGVVGGLDMARRRLEQGRDQDVARYMIAARDSADRAAGLTRRLLAFASRQRLEPEPMNANTLVSGMADLILRTVGPAITLDVILCDGGWLALCDPSELESAILNLCINARDAMPQGGQLTIATEQVHLQAAELPSTEKVHPGDYVAIRVVDTGAGMPPKVLQRATEPFFTTKPQGQGTGLGLSQIYGFTRQSGGMLQIESAPGHGTAVHILLPCVNPEQVHTAKADDAAVEGTIVMERGIVLMVDDEAAVRVSAGERLRDVGYQVVEAPDGPSALRLLDEGLRPDLLISDVGLPNGMDGLAVSEAVRQRLPGLPVLFMTGYARVALPEDAAVITKPFDLRDLVAKVKTVLKG